MRSLFKITAKLGLLLTACAAITAWGASDGSPADTDIRYIGRWDRSDPAVYNSYWSGAYFRTKFTGTSVGLKLTFNTGLAVSIDGEAIRPLSGAKGVTKLNPVPLKAGDHTLQVGSGGQNDELGFQGLVLDAGAMTKPAAERPIIEYIGDSITQGNDSYAWLSAEMLGCDHVQIAFSGVALSSGYTSSKPEKTGLDTQYFCLKNFNHLKEQPATAWDFSYTPRVVVINLGQNEPSEPPADFVSNYIKFVRNLRARFPLAEIVAIGPFSGNHAEDVSQAVLQLNKDDKRVHFVETKGWLRPDDFKDHIHPNATGNLKVAWRVATILSPLLAQ